jgi:hypothetical protein
MASNTVIQILRSYANTKPSSLNDGELAFSFLSNTLFIGDDAGHIIEIGGETYISNVAANTVITLIDGGEF